MFSMTRWSPLTPMFQLRREIDDVFGRVAGQTYGDGEAAQRTDASGRGQEWTRRRPGSRSGTDPGRRWVPPRERAGRRAGVRRKQDGGAPCSSHGAFEGRFTLRGRRRQQAPVHPRLRHHRAGTEAMPRKVNVGSGPAADGREGEARLGPADRAPPACYALPPPPGGRVSFVQPRGPLNEGSTARVRDCGAGTASRAGRTDQGTAAHPSVSQRAPGAYWTKVHWGGRVARTRFRCVNWGDRA
jgi:hypothetical protein